MRARVVGSVVALLVAVVPVAGHAQRQPPPSAEPTLGPLISGATSLVDGVHVWTDYAYDDRGTSAGSAATYPSEADPGNAADLIQLQLTPGPRALRIRAVLET